MIAAPLPSGWPSEGLKCSGCLVLRHHAGNFAFIGKVERIETQDLTKGFDFLTQRGRGLRNFDADARRSGRLVENRGEPASGRVANEAGSGSSREQFSNEFVQRCTITLNLGRKRHVATRVEDRRAMIAKHAIDDNRIARLAAVGAKVHTFPDNPDPGRVKEKLVAGAFVHDLRVTRDDGDPGIGSG